MVLYADILNSNSSLRYCGSGLTAAFVGATNGIGLATLMSLTRNTDSPTIFVVGRSRSKLEHIVSRLKTLNEEGTYHPILSGDLSLTREAAGAAAEICKRTARLDLVLMSPGWLSFGADYSPEGIDRMQSLRYHTRLSFLLPLLPLLRLSPSPRIVSILLAGKEGRLFENDFSLRSNYSVKNAGGQAASMTSLIFEELAQKPGNEKLVFVHLHPGTVSGTGLTSGSNVGVWGRLLLRYIAPWVIWAIGYGVEEVGERVVFVATSGRFRRLEKPLAPEEAQGDLGVRVGMDGRVGSGVYRVDADTEVCVRSEVLENLRKEGMGEVVYRYTMGEIDKLGGMR